MEGGGDFHRSKHLDFITFLAFLDSGLCAVHVPSMYHPCIVHLPSIYGSTPPLCSTYLRYLTVPGRKNPGGALTISSPFHHLGVHPGSPHRPDLEGFKPLPRTVDPPTIVDPL